MDERSRYMASNVPFRGHHPPPADRVDWIEVSAAAPCPRCGAHDGCSVAPAGRFVRCRLIPSAHPLEGGGWLHTVRVAGAGTEPAPAGGDRRG
jgi:hypothetical protein